MELAGGHYHPGMANSPKRTGYATPTKTHEKTMVKNVKPRVEIDHGVSPSLWPRPYLFGIYPVADSSKRYNSFMESIFILKLILSFVIGGLWVILATVLADKLGSKVGGLVSGLPSTVMFGLFFLAWTQNPSTAVQATTIIPIVGGVNCLFLACYVYFVRRNVWQAIISSLILWSFLSYLLIQIHFDNYTASIIGYCVLFTLAFFLMENVFKIHSVKGEKIIYTPLLIVGRGLLGGCVVALAVYLGKIGGPVLGGMFSMFPAMFISTMLVTYYSHGALFSAGTMKSSMVSGISIVAYSIIARYTYIPLDLWFGTLVSILVSFGIGVAIYKLVIIKLN